MTSERASEFQDSIMREAVAQIAMFGDNASTETLERSIKLIGKAWSLPTVITEQRLKMIEQERRAVREADTPENAKHVLPESELPINATGNETLNLVWDLFETAVRLDDRSQRQHLYNTAWSIAETQNLLDWISLSAKEKQELSA